jgi:hypothetical protein
MVPVDPTQQDVDYLDHVPLQRVDGMKIGTFLERFKPFWVATSVSATIAYAKTGFQAQNVAR